MREKVCAASDLSMCFTSESEKPPGDKSPEHVELGASYLWSNQNELCEVFWDTEEHVCLYSSVETLKVSRHCHQTEALSKVLCIYVFIHSFVRHILRRYTQMLAIEQ